MEFAGQGPLRITFTSNDHLVPEPVTVLGELGRKAEGKWNMVIPPFTLVSPRWPRAACGNVA